MTKWTVTFEGEVPAQDIEVLSDLGNALMDALIETGAEDPCLWADLGQISIEVVVEGRTRSEALAKGMVVIDTALAAAHLESQTASAHAEQVSPAA